MEKYFFSLSIFFIYKYRYYLTPISYRFYLYNKLMKERFNKNYLILNNFKSEIFPNSLNELNKILLLSNKYKIPIYTNKLFIKLLNSKFYTILNLKNYSNINFKDNKLIKVESGINLKDFISILNKNNLTLNALEYFKNSNLNLNDLYKLIINKIRKYEIIFPDGKIYKINKLFFFNYGIISRFLIKTNKLEKFLYFKINFDDNNFKNKFIFDRIKIKNETFYKIKLKYINNFLYYCEINRKINDLKKIEESEFINNINKIIDNNNFIIALINDNFLLNKIINKLNKKNKNFLSSFKHKFILIEEPNDEILNFLFKYQIDYFPFNKNNKYLFFQKYGYNLSILHNKLKNLFDYNNILNPSNSNNFISSLKNSNRIINYILTLIKI